MGSNKEDEKDISDSGGGGCAVVGCVGETLRREEPSRTRGRRNGFKEPALFIVSFFFYNFLTGELVMEEGVKLSNAVERYALGGFVRLRGGVLKLYEDKIALSRLAGSMEIPLSELERYAKRD